MRAFSMVALRRRDESGAATARESQQLRQLVASQSAPQRVEGVASLVTRVECVDERAALTRLRELLVDRGQHCVPVVADDGRPIGVVTQSDLLRSLCRPVDPAAPPAREPIAREMMSPLLFALPVSASVDQAAALMAYEGVDQIVVTGMSGQVAGVVRALDVARRCARSAGYLVDRQE